MEFRFVYKNGHIEVYDTRDKFLFSADTRREAAEECREILSQKEVA